MLIDENLDRRIVTKTRKPQYRALSAGTSRYNTKPRWVYGQAVISEYLKQQREENKNESE